MSTSTYRLPTHATPRRYDIWLDAQVGREDFHGRVVIALELHKEHDTIDLHARDLTISDAILTMNGHSLPARVTMDPDNERMILQFPQSIQGSEASLDVTFHGKVSQTLKGLYLAQDRPEQLLCTQCEATDARAIFPCFDEPTFKAQFALDVTTPDPVVLGNSPLLSGTDNEATK